MGTLLLMGLGPMEMIIIVLAILVLFGAKSIPNVARGLGKGLNEFRKAAEDIKKEIRDNSDNISDDINDFKNTMNK